MQNINKRTKYLIPENILITIIFALSPFLLEIYDSFDVWTAKIILAIFLIVLLMLLPW